MEGKAQQRRALALANLSSCCLSGCLHRRLSRRRRRRQRPKTIRGVAFHRKRIFVTGDIIHYQLLISTRLTLRTRPRVRGGRARVPPGALAPCTPWRARGAGRICARNDRRGPAQASCSTRPAAPGCWEELRAHALGLGRADGYSQTYATRLTQATRPSCGSPSRSTCSSSTTSRRDAMYAQESAMLCVAPPRSS